MGVANLSPECSVDHDMGFNLQTCSDRDNCTCECHDPRRLGFPKDLLLPGPAPTEGRISGV